jgi:hypothetical protein
MHGENGGHLVVGTGRTETAFDVVPEAGNMLGLAASAPCPIRIIKASSVRFGLGSI